jgi:hypothetical protein
MADYEGVLADLKARRTALDREKSELETMITGIERLISTSSGQARQPTAVSPRAFSGSLTMPDALTKCLKLAQQQPQTKRQIQDTLKVGGMKAGKSFGAHVYNTLKRLSGPDGRFRRESDGRWSLREWPAMTSEGNLSNAATTH